MLKRFTLLSTFLLFVIGSATAQITKVITDADLVGSTTYNWSADTIYQLDGYVYLEADGVLNIAPGTRIEGLANPSDANDLASTLIITRDATITANGTAAQPIVFTAEGEDENFSVPDDRGSWGGLVILGNAPVGEENATGVANIEGIPQEARTQYGGTNVNDNSGSLRYVSIRYGGAVLADNNEINGLTLGGVGNGTLIEFIEVFGNNDDGIEFFGGSVDVKHAIVAFCKDDSFDSDQAWSGRGQFWFTIQLPNDQTGNNQNGGEHDGSENPADNGGPVQTVYNATYIGMGTDMDNGESNTGLRIKNGAAITYVNSIITDFGRNGIRLQDNSYDRYLADDFEISSNIWYNFGGATDATNLVRVDDGDDASAVATKLLGAGNTIEDPLFNGVSRMPNGMLDPRPGSGSPARTGAATPADPWFTSTSYVGAFSPSTNWATDWTHTDERGYFGDLDGDGSTIVITDADLQGGVDYNWTADNVYRLDGYVYLEEGGCLNIEAGTRIEGLAVPSNANDLASTLIIARGAKINAVGTADAPIVFTAEGEDESFSVPDDRGSWGGLVILGNALVGEENATGVANIEGIPQEARTQYGGTDDNDDSGTLRYVSIRYGGAVLADNNEINGLTLGGVGKGTDISFIEVYGNNDDGIEFFGGSVDVKHAIVAFCKDDSFDSDQAWSGRGQFWFTIQLPNDQTGNNQNGGEHDGSENAADNGGPVQTVYNATYIGMGTDMDNGESNTGLRIKNGAAITYVNSIITDFGRNGIRLQDNSYDRYLADDFEISSNIWYNFGGAADATNLVRVDDGDDASAVATKLLGAGNTIEDPILNGVSRMPNGMLDPRPGSGSPARTGAATPTDDWFTPTSYKGAFSPTSNWATDWTHVDDRGYFGDLDGEGSTIVITDADLVANTTYNWTADNVYRLDGYVYLEEGGCLNIEAGTRIEGLAVPSNTNDLASTLIITRGAKINAVGTAEAPIVFTAEGEDESFSVPDDRGSWGGLVILGRAPVGEENATGIANIEGIPQEARTQYGGTNNDDDSGSLRYVSIRYGGAVLADNNEINGLTLGGVGKGTDISFIEVYGNNDDGIEFFGGSVDVKNAVVAFCKDDSFDSDQAWSGRGQFWFTIQLPNDQSGNNQNGGEHDGSENPADNGGPVQTVYNATYIGMGTDMDNGESNTGLRIKNGAAITYVNSIITDFGRNGIRLQDNSYDRYLADDFEISSNIWYNFGDATDATNLVRVDDGDDASAIATKLLGAGNTIEDPMISGVSRTPNGMLDPRPTVGSPAYQNIADVPAEDDFFQSTGYRGAFSFGNNWATGWTHMDERGYFGDLVADKPTKNIQDVDLVAGQTYNWSADTIYVLDGYVFLEQGGVLNIAAGTVVQGGATPSDANDLTSALVITRGAKINAIGTAEEPIIFTAEGEDGNFTIPDDRGSWGGLIILGNATVGEENATGIANVEGIPQEDRTQYGGGTNPIDDEDSGTLRYLSIRYGGAVLADNNEINGLTLGGVGSGTDISYIEVYGNNDDGIEFFGGSVDVKYASVIFCKDDSFDSDQSWSGRGQFWFTLMLPNDQTGNNQNGGEHDGSENPADNGGPVQTVWNATYIGMGQDMDNGESNTGLRIKNGAAINYSNSIFTEFGKDGLRLQDNSYDRFLAGDFVLQNNIWWNFGDGNTPADFVRVDDGDDVAAVVNLLVNEQGNAVVDPALTQVNWTASADGGADGNGTDPRPSADSPVTENTATVPMDDFYSDVAFKGAFSNDATEPYWITWTHAFEQGVLVDLRTGVTDFERNDAGVMLAVPSPNPASVTTQLDISLPVASEVKLTIFDQMGRRVSDRVLGNLPAGDNVYNLDVQRLVNGHYFLLLETNRGAVAQRVVINR